MNPRYQSQPQINRPRLNHQIRVAEVQVIGPEGQRLGTMPTSEALRMAGEQSLDLVEINGTSQPPLVKIIDYNKYQYLKEKRERESKSNQTKSRGSEVKVVKIGFRTETHDLGVRCKQVEKFLGKGYRVKVELTLRGREKGMAVIGKKKLEDFTKTISVAYTVEAPLKSFPGGIGILIRAGK